jgi:hypothetical protein
MGQGISMIISLSGKKRSGKTTVANHLISKYGFLEVSWAYPLKEIIGKQLFGLTDDHLYGPDEIREETITEWGMSPRRILQVVGTDLFRTSICDDFWVRAGLKVIRKHLSEGNLDIVVSDSRFPNEADALKELGGITVQVRKIKKESKAMVVQGGKVLAKTTDTSQHPSEKAMDDYEFDYILQSFEGEINLLHKRTDTLLTELREGENAFSE